MADKTNNYNGIINVYKEAGFTSFDVVAKMRGICGQKKIGHTGTLDPDATGVLPVCLGNATKVCELLTDHDKEYVAELLLGVRTDTQDVTGKSISGACAAEFDNLLDEDALAGACERSSMNADDKEIIKARMKSIAGDKVPSEGKIRETIETFIGEIDQIPPMYSALKVNGQKLCDLARKGVEVERTARKITVHEIEILEIDLPVVKMRVHCSKGTYIRTLCDDIGEALGCGGTMLSLVRSKVGPFVLGNAVSLEDLQRMKDDGKLDDAVLSVDSLFGGYKPLRVKEEAMKMLLNGNVLYKNSFENALSSKESPKDHELFRIYKHSGEFAGIYYYNAADKLYKPEKMFL